MVLLFRVCAPRTFPGFVGWGSVAAVRQVASTTRQAAQRGGLFWTKRTSPFCLFPWGFDRGKTGGETNVMSLPSPTEALLPKRDLFVSWRCVRAKCCVLKSKTQTKRPEASTRETTVLLMSRRLGHACYTNPIGFLTVELSTIVSMNHWQ